MSLIGDVRLVCLSDMYYLKRNIVVLVATSLVTPLLYLVAFGWGLGDGVTMEYDGRDYSYIAYMIPGTVALTSLTAGFTTVSNKLMIQRKFYESFDEMMLCPVTKSSIILGKAVLGIIKSMLCSFFMLALGCLLTDDMSVTPALIATVATSCVVFSLLGVAAGMNVRDLPHMNAINSFVILPMTFLCGTMFPVDKMPEVIGYAVRALPLTPSSECIRAAALGADYPWISLLIMLAWGVLFFFVARHGLRQSD
ncbi:MAG: ABC transporter [Thermoplasmata archaeon]|nr:ABC transporter [Thermoplasmata archaeon]